ncbi:hypothetical protein HPB48_025958 [Haemaphysalis longicornis]|uniref:Uncharacterized protein n=1 Tax=Haemaphysalis longicornis TaxID=44386 RepID=A0A9J6HB38_HAELO|nr:hypothetical protein HPB48_025958 [Haemaphysalis longicornis]
METNDMTEAVAAFSYLVRSHNCISSIHLNNTNWDTRALKAAVALKGTVPCEVSHFRIQGPCQPELLMTMLEIIGILTNLRTLDIFNVAVGSDLASKLSKVIRGNKETLRTVTLVVPAIEQDGLIGIIHELALCPKIISLTLRCPMNTVASAIVANVIVTRENLKNMVCDDKAGSALSRYIAKKLKEGCSLTDLEITSSDEGTTELILDSITTNNNLKSITVHLQGSRLGTFPCSETLRNVLEKNTAISRMSFIGEKASSHDADIIAKGLRTNKTLAELRLHVQDFEGALHLCRALKYSGLELLNIGPVNAQQAQR